MFTGLIEEVGTVRSVALTPSGAGVAIQAREVLAGTEIGDSISVNGCCLTVTDLPGDSLVAHAGIETLQRTTVSRWRAGQAVNLERSLTPASRMGGHIVQGHVDGVGSVVSMTREGETTRARFSLPEDLAGFVVVKGSIAVDGISLTVAAMDADSFAVSVIPHTLEHTTLGGLLEGDSVNVEVDIIAKYVHRMLSATRADGGDITEELLREQGFC